MLILLHETKQKYGSTVVYPPPQSSLSSFPVAYYSTNHEEEATPTSSVSGISPVLLLLIVILAVLFFIYGILHLLFRCFIKRPSSSTIYQSNRFTDTSGSRAFQRQLQQLFRLHDSGLEQAFIDALPVFYYKDIMGTDGPFDCAVCLCEFSEQDKLRLLPTCSHAFHIDCIDTWLLSNSTCPLCRRTLLGSSNRTQIPAFNFDVPRELSNRFPGDGESGFSSSQRTITIDESIGEKRVFSVRLGKFRSFHEGVASGERRGETSSRNLDARRCYSMGTFQYVVDDSALLVALSESGSGCGEGDGDSNVKFVKARGHPANFSVHGDVEGKKISDRAKGESFSVSKIWLWSKKSRYPSSSNSRMDLSPSLNVSVPINGETRAA
ncbi:RING-H2 finger protein ATL46 [Morella rubra]|uniref:RING-type E3 ubiquitin transferase n=1 Tax=Morella rubra TaxID=262757 RepID=A0A6A1VH44_9ROSI|nr:RING-H2 finger protein ATL46 [Morella rubra]